MRLSVRGRIKCRNIILKLINLSLNKHFLITFYKDSAIYFSRNCSRNTVQRLIFQLTPKEPDHRFHILKSMQRDLF